MIDLTTDPDIGYGRDRCKIAAWRDAPGADGKTLTCELRVSHDRDRKAFRVTFTRSLASFDRGYRVNEYQPFRDIARLPSTPCARYSDKALDAAFSAALPTLLDAAGTEPIAGLLDRAAGE